RPFDIFGHKLRVEITHDLFRFALVPPDEPALEQLLSRLQLERNRSFMADLGERLSQMPAQALSPSMQQASAPPPEQQRAPEKPQPITVLPKVGRNDPCPCGSGKKFKKCCGA